MVVADCRFTVTSTVQGSMKTVFALAIACSFLSVTMAVTVTNYVNSVCTGTLAATGGVTNPQVFVLGVCQTDPASPGGRASTSSAKFTSCGTTATLSNYGGGGSTSDTTCSLASTVTQTLAVGQCLPAGGSGGSFMVTCASGTSITLALASVAVAALSFCL
jgi:hypothetical protein